MPTQTALRDLVCNMWTIPDTVSDDIISIVNIVHGRWVGLIPIFPELWANEYYCHKNVEIKVDCDGGNVVYGYYILHFKDLNIYQMVSHSVWKSPTELIDITPTQLPTNFFMFIVTDNKPKNNNWYFRSSDKYYIEQETEILYYVYGLIDPRNNMPFYIGKGKGRRAKTHLWDIPETRNQYKENKISSIRNEGLEPRIEYFAENIIDEKLAYDIEKSLIERYGR